MSDMPKVYLAGPEVFFPAPLHKTIVARKKAMLTSYGLAGADPLDNALELPEDEAGPAQANRIYQANRKLMDDCQAIIANLTPFRSISADPGTVFEVGYMVGQGKLAVGFTLDERDYRRRSGSRDGFDANGHSIEDFGLSDNLMIDCSIQASGGALFRLAGFSTEGNGDTAPAFFDEELFQRCAEAVAEVLGTHN
ncbi:nucleoside 2-deoxyribosyltransferase [uncultured Marinobacter sp.]|uniref:nucleoside 2-deoxyribosyltransferase n=1 Tax=uncultured Marinobacter sp. TaxID=187379 RepID=UPI0030D79C4A